ncbi:MAG: cell division protein FtsA [Oligoflexia bacterium]|nr:cell division protein FtsA [Oligoflexia bacterium]
MITTNMNVVAGLDIGTSKVSIVIARVQQKTLEVIGVSSVACNGIKKGAVVNIEATTEAIKKAREEAELMSGVKISSAWAGVSASHVSSFNSTGMVAIRDKEVRRDDVERVVEAAQAVAIKEDRELLHVLPQTFIVDSQSSIRDPIGMSGVRLEVGAHLVAANSMTLINLRKCAYKANLQINGFILETLAAAEAVLSNDEKDLGVAVVDIGAASSDIIIYQNGSVVFSCVVPVGGAHLTHDISIGLRTPATNAEEIKIKFGAAMANLITDNDVIEVASVGGRSARSVSRSSLAEVIEPRAEEIITLIHDAIRKSGYADMLGAGVVLTGGASQLEGMAELAEYIIEMPVRKACALNIMGLKEVVNSPSYATVLGLILLGSEKQKNTPAMAKATTFIEKIKNEISQLF